MPPLRGTARVEDDDDRENRMTPLGRRIVLATLAMLIAILLAFPAAAHQARGNPDGAVNPTASAVQEQKLLQQLGQIDGRVSIPNRRAGVLEQPAGRDWRQFHEVTLRIIGAVA